MPLTLNNTNTLTADNIVVSGTNLSDLYATKTELDNLNFTTDITANTDAIAILNTKQLQNFNAIDDINTDLTNNYQTNTVLATNFYNKTELDATFSNYYTSTQIDTNLSTNYQNNTLLATNFYNKTEVDTLIAGAGGGGGYTDTEIDNFLALKANLSLFTDNVSFFPVIDLSRPTILHQGLTIKNSTFNIEPLAGILFSNQFGAETDRDVAIFRNQTSYITLKGDKILCNNTSDDAIKQLDLLNNNAGYKMSGKIETPTGGLVIENTADANLSFTVRNTDNYITFNNGSIDCYNSSDDTGRILNLNANANEYVKSHSLLVDTASNTLTGGYTLDVVDSAIVRQNLRVDGNLDLTNDLNYDGENANINNANGLTFYKNTTDASNVLTVKNAQGYLKFNSFNINAYNTSNDSSSLLLLNTANGNGVYCLSLGIGAIAGGNKLNVAGSSNFGGTSSFQNIATFNSDIYINNSGRIFQRADANNSLNVISTNEINFSLQSNRTTDPTTGTIALQLNDTNGITINRAVTNNLTFNSIGNIVGEADVISWGRFMFQNSSELKEVLDTQYKLYVRNGDALGEINLTVGLESSTPEIQLTDGKVNLLGNLEITHTDVSGSQRVLINNPDTDGFIRLSNNNLSRLDATNTGVDVYGFFTTTNNADIGGNVTCVALTETSDSKLKENIKEVNRKDCYKAFKYIKPKTYNFKNDEDKKSHIGFIADDIKDAKMPKEWDNIIYYNDDGMKLLAYNKTAVVLWGCVQELMKEVEDLKKEVKKLKRIDSEDDKPKPKAKSKSK